MKPTNQNEVFGALYLLPGGNRVQSWHLTPIIFVISGRILKEGGKAQQSVVDWLRNEYQTGEVGDHEMHSMA